MEYIIKECSVEEVHLLQAFIDKHWKKDHPLAKSIELLNFQHLNRKTTSYNYIIGINSETKEIDGIIGYIPTSQYDPSLHNQGDYWPAIWKVRSDVSNPEIKFLGLLLWEALNQKEIHTLASIGISAVAKKFYKIAKLKIDYLRQYYIVNNESGLFDIAKVKEVQKISNKSLVNSETRMVKQVSAEDLSNLQLMTRYTPAKTITYLLNRYEKHPYYRYRFFSLSDLKDEINAIIVTRTIEIGNSRAIRIVDCIGDLSSLPVLYDDFQSILKNENAEYIDCMNFGIEEEIFERIGFSKLDINAEDIVIPNYFEPFEKRNIKIEFAYKSSVENYVVFKGDSDQDRPNIL